MFDRDDARTQGAAGVSRLGGRPTDEPVELAGPVALLVAALDALTAQAPADIPAAQAICQARALLVQHDRLRALALARVADIENRQLHDLEGAPSTPAWVAQQQTSLTRQQVTLARRLDRVPQIAVQIAAGALSVEGGVRIERTLAALRPHVDRPDGTIDRQPGEQVLPAVIVDGVRLVVAEAAGGLDDDDPRLVELAAELAEIAARPVSQLARLEAAFLVLSAHVEPGQLKGALGMLADALLPSSLAEKEEDGHRERRLELARDPDGSGWTVRGHLDLETGEMLHAALAAAMTTDPDNPHDTAEAAALRDQDVDPYSDGCSQVRSRVQRTHDGLTVLLRRLLDSGALGTRGKHVPHIGITISAGALHDEPGALPGRAGSGATLPAGLVRRLLCDSAITRFVLSAGHRVLEASHTERTLKPHERRIKAVETGDRCQAAGCQRGTATGHPLIPHHANAYARSGSTSLSDTVLLCAASHRDVHEGQRTIRLKDGRRVGPDGWEA